MIMVVRHDNDNDFFQGVSNNNDNNICIRTTMRKLKQCLLGTIALHGNGIHTEQFQMSL